jgi:hypothetical protein
MTDIAPTEITEAKPTDQERDPKEFFRSVAVARKELIYLINSYNTMKIEGKSISEWSEYFQVNIPDIADLSKIRELLARVNRLYEFASTKHDEANLTFSLLKREVKDVFAKRFSKLKGVAYSSKPPSNEELTQKIDAEIALLRNQETLAEYLVEFWASKKEKLVFTRRILETMSISTGQELKHKEYYQRDVE